MSFYERHGVVRAVQWLRMGDHPSVGFGVHIGAGLLDIQVAAPYARRHVEAGDWVVRESDGTHTVITDAEFRNSYRGV